MNDVNVSKTAIMENILIVRKSKESDLNDILDVEAQAFGNEEGPKIVDLVNGLFFDPTAIPLLSLMAVSEDRATGTFCSRMHVSAI